MRKIPSELCGLLNRDPDSPFYQLIKRISTDKEKQGVIVDSAIIEMIQNSIRNPLGALAQFKSLGSEASDLDKMYSHADHILELCQDSLPRCMGPAISPKPINALSWHHCYGHLDG